MTSSQQQDSVAAVSLFETLVARTKALLPALQTIRFQANNAAAAYASPFLVFMLPNLRPPQPVGMTSNTRMVNMYCILQLCVVGIRKGRSRRVGAICQL